MWTRVSFLTCGQVPTLNEFGRGVVAKCNPNSLVAGQTRKQTTAAFCAAVLCLAVVGGARTASAVSSLPTKCTELGGQMATYVRVSPCRLYSRNGIPGHMQRIEIGYPVGGVVQPPPSFWTYLGDLFQGDIKGYVTTRQIASTEIVDQECGGRQPQDDPDNLAPGYYYDGDGVGVCVHKVGPYGDIVFEDGPSIPNLGSAVLNDARAEFWPAGVFHDMCYHHGRATYGYTRWTCDEKMRQDMYSLCDYRNQNWQCWDDADIIFDTLRSASQATDAWRSVNTNIPYAAYFPHPVDTFGNPLPMQGTFGGTVTLPPPDVEPSVEELLSTYREELPNEIQQRIFETPGLPTPVKDVAIYGLQRMVGCRSDQLCVSMKRSWLYENLLFAIDSVPTGARTAADAYWASTGVNVATIQRDDVPGDSTAVEAQELVDGLLACATVVGYAGYPVPSIPIIEVNQFARGLVDSIDGYRRGYRVGGADPEDASTTCFMSTTQQTDAFWKQVEAPGVQFTPNLHDMAIPGAYEVWGSASEPHESFWLGLLLRHLESMRSRYSWPLTVAEIAAVTSVVGN